MAKQFDITNLFLKPRIVGLVGDVNTGKSMAIYWIIKSIQKRAKENKKPKPTIRTFGLHVELPNTTRFNSLEELEQMKDSIIIIDELPLLLELDDRNKKKQVEKTLRVINHKNNVLLICGTGENFKKFLSAKLDAIIYKKVTFAELIRGCSLKYTLLSYCGYEMGSKLINLSANEALVFDGLSYYRVFVPKTPFCDTKKGNKTLF